jgi:rhodanese-related sulfurtransferase
LIEHITPLGLQSWIAESAAQGLKPVLLDVREGWELDIARIAPAGVQFAHIPMQLIPQSLDQLPRHQPLAVLCHHGVRSMHVARFLQAQGFTQVYNLQGGIDAWSAQVDQQVAVY